MTSTSIADPIVGQVRRLWWRHNLYGLQRALYLLIATSAAAAAVLVVLAVGSADRFGAGLAGVGLAAALAAILIGRATWRGWLGARRVAPWVDRRMGLDGRLATLLALPAERHGSTLYPLLVEQNVQRLPTWEPERLIPVPVPLIALAGAIVASYALFVVVRMAPASRPPPPAEVARTERPIARVDHPDAAQTPPRRALVAPQRGSQSPGTGGGRSEVAAAGDEGRARSSLPATIRSAVRRRVLGERPARVQLAGTPSPRPTGAGEQEGEGGDTMSAGAGERRENGTAKPGSPPRAAGDPAAAGQPDPTAGPTRAGNGAAPDLYGTPNPERTARESFPLGLGARVHGPGGASRAPSGEAPPGAPDEHPTLGPGQRPGAPFHKMPVPRDYEAIVRALFTHRP